MTLLPLVFKNHRRTLITAFFSYYTIVLLSRAANDTYRYTTNELISSQS